MFDALIKAVVNNKTLDTRTFVSKKEAKVFVDEINSEYREYYAPNSSPFVAVLGEQNV